VRIVFMGTPEFAVPSLEGLVREGYEVSAVYTQPDREAGRGRSVTASPVKQAATGLGLHTEHPVRLRDKEIITRLAEFQPEVIVVAAFGQILPQAVLDIPKYKCINLHPSLLPRYRGAAPIPAAILAGDAFSGVSIMLMDAGLDTGPVLAQAQIAISPGDTTGTLTEKLALVSAEQLLEVLPLWTAGKITPRPQGETSTPVTKMLEKAEGEIDWDLPAEVLWRRVRAFQPWPGCFTHWKGRQLKIIEAVPLDKPEGFGVGQVGALNQKDAAFGVGTGEGILGIVRVQLEGKRAMSSSEFLRGQPQITGAVVDQK
jgi:methionyl-tRNA formyltransferase